jgi:hypothetical protein
MKIIALILACCLWLSFFLFLKIQINFSYRWQDLTSYLQLDLKILFFRFHLEFKIPKEIYSLGLEGFLTNAMADIADLENGAGDRKAGKKSERKKTRRYLAVKRFGREILRHYIFSFSRFTWLKRKLSTIRKNFYQKIEVDAFEILLEIGGEDAAETGLMTGAFWTLFGYTVARLFRIVTVNKDNIKIMVKPHFDREVFLCRFHCILNLKISHIIFTGYKFLLMILKNRRIRNYGRASH